MRDWILNLDLVVIGALIILVFVVAVAVVALLCWGGGKLFLALADGIGFLVFRGPGASLEKVLEKAGAVWARIKAPFEFLVEWWVNPIFRRRRTLRI
jgi:hypothetical protein